jgi:enoyl-CoA hydratase/carnithine racemase
MLVELSNAVKVECVPLNSNYFFGPRRADDVTADGTPKLRSGDIAPRRVVRERSDERLHPMLAINEDGPVLRVELNRPESLNCLDDDVLLEVTDLYTRLQQRFDLKAVVLGGRGRAFCAGADLRNPPGFGGTGGRERRYHSQIGYRACQAIADCEVVTVARLHGHVVGGGLALALACDFRVAATDTVFRLPEVDLGVPMTWGTIPRLIAEVGAARAREIVLLADRIDAATAHRISLVHRLAALDELDDATQALVEVIVAKPDYALHTSKTQFRAYSRASGDPTFADGDLVSLATRFNAAR